MPSTIGKCKLFRIKHITLLEGEAFLRNKHKIAFFEIKCTLFGRKENTIKEHILGAINPDKLKRKECKTVTRRQPLIHVIYWQPWNKRTNLLNIFLVGSVLTYLPDERSEFVLLHSHH